MSRSIAMQFAAPAVIPLQADKVDIALYFVDGVRSINGKTSHEMRDYVAQQLKVSVDELDEFDYYLDDYFSAELRGARIDREDFVLTVAPEEGSWAEMGEDSLKTLMNFIKRFGKDVSLPILLHSVSVESSSGSWVGDTLTSEFVHLTEVGVKVFRQATEGSDYGHNSGGFLTEMMKKNPELHGVEVTEVKEFD